MADIDVVQQDLALLKELEIAIRLLQIGCREVQNSDGTNTFYHLAMLTLANGFERFMKVIICLHIHARTGKYPTKAPWSNQREGHNLLYLLDRVVTDCFTEDYVTNIPAAAADINYLQTSERSRDLRKLLFNFGQRGARYYYIDLVTGQKPSVNSPDEDWSRLKMSIFKEDTNGESSFKNDPNLSSSYQRINYCILFEIEKMARALSRLFTLGPLGPKGRQLSGVVAPFLMLSEHQLGNLKY